MGRIGELFELKKCDQTGCSAAIDGSCLEGLSLESCPHFSYERLDAEQIEDDSKEQILTAVNEATVQEKAFKTIHSGEELDLDGTFTITRDKLTRLVILTGLSNVGKTTMLACLYELFQRRQSICGYRFSGSLTLIGFEKRCHLSRMASGAPRPDTQRTPQIGPFFLHLSVQSICQARSEETLLLTDISGEYFESIYRSVDEFREFELIKRADYVVLFMDSEPLSDMQKRHSAKQKGMTQLRILVESNMLKGSIPIQIIFSKWDLLLEKDQANTHMSFICGIEQEISKKYPDLIHLIKFHRISSRDLSGHSDQQTGIEGLFSEWVSKPGGNHDTKHKQSSEAPNALREFSMYRFKYEDK